jgi:hypothetical protein
MKKTATTTLKQGTTGTIQIIETTTEDPKMDSTTTTMLETATEALKQGTTGTTPIFEATTKAPNNIGNMDTTATTAMVETTMTGLKLRTTGTTKIFETTKKDSKKDTTTITAMMVTTTKVLKQGTTGTSEIIETTTKAPKEDVTTTTAMIETTVEDSRLSTTGATTMSKATTEAEKLGNPGRLAVYFLLPDPRQIFTISQGIWENRIYVIKSPKPRTLAKKVIKSRNSNSQGHLDPLMVFERVLSQATKARALEKGCYPELCYGAWSPGAPGRGLGRVS